MPLYEYRCRACGERFEKLVSISTSTADITCPTCQQREAERLISQVAAVGAACDAGTIGGGGG